MINLQRESNSGDTIYYGCQQQGKSLIFSFRWWCSLPFFCTLSLYIFTSCLDLDVVDDDDEKEEDEVTSICDDDSFPRLKKDSDTLKKEVEVVNVPKVVYHD